MEKAEGREFSVLHSLSDFSSQAVTDQDLIVNGAALRYWYTGLCPRTNQWFRLPRTVLVETIAGGLMQVLATEEQYAQEGKMYGVLLVETSAGERRVLKAFSGLLQGQPEVAGWVPPIAGRDRVALQEAYTLSRLDALKQELLRLQQLPERQQYEDLAQDFQQRLQQLSVCHQQRRQERQQHRQQLSDLLQGEALALHLTQFDDQSRRDGRERRSLKQQRDGALRSLKQTIDQADAQMRDLKQQRKALSQQLQAQMHTAYCLTNFAGESVSLQQLVAGGALPTGTGECCAPKLLHYAATHGLKPLAMAEFWWGAAFGKGDKVQGEFYGACAERCQPLMGFLLSGSSGGKPGYSLVGEPLPVLYEDEWLIVVNKPAGLLSVPGRYSDRQDSVLSRLRQRLPDSLSGSLSSSLPGSPFLMTVHRLDQATSGILLLARDPQTYGALSQQFQQRQVRKVYEAIVAGTVAAAQGMIDLPLWGDPADRPRQIVDWQRGKPSLTSFQVMALEELYTRIELIPVTGRTHQLRVHAADARGLNVPILGDRLYGCNQPADRLHLHARELSIRHPHSGQLLCLQTETPF